MAERGDVNPELATTVDEVMYLGGFAVWYADVSRATHYHERAESDVEHSYMLSLVALHLADRYYPELNQGLIAQFCLIHDSPEAIVSDTPTFNIAPEDRAIKEEAESFAVEKLLSELPPYWAQLLERYEAQQEPEARFVRLVDKVMPPLVNSVGDGATTFLSTYGITNKQELLDIRRRRSLELRELFPEFPEVCDVRDEIVKIMHATLFDPETGALIHK